MFTVYVLQDGQDRLYKGVTNNLPRRLKEHNLGKTKTTRFMRNLRVIYSEEFTDFSTARRRELYFKSSAGRRFLKKFAAVAQR